MRRDDLKQLRSLIMEIEEEEERSRFFGAWSLLDDVQGRTERNQARIRMIRAWIDDIPDSITRRAFALRYLDGLRWQDVAIRMGYDSPDGPRKLCERYLALHP